MLKLPFLPEGPTEGQLLPLSAPPFAHQGSMRVPTNSGVFVRVSTIR